MLALKLNIDFSDAGLLKGDCFQGLMKGGSPFRFGDLMLCNLSTSLSGLNGLTIRDFLPIVNTLLGGGTASFTIVDLTPVTADLNDSFGGGLASSFAQEHLMHGPCH